MLIIDIFFTLPFIAFGCQIILMFYTMFKIDKQAASILIGIILLSVWIASAYVYFINEQETTHQEKVVNDDNK
jgi:hypothetical protein